LFFEAGLIDTQRIAELIEPSLEGMGYALVRVQHSGGKHPTLQVRAERRDGAPMTVDDCAEISRNISAILDVNDPIASAYSLEVSSPGIDRPLVRAEDYDRFCGYEARLELRQGINGQKKFKGRLLGRAGGQVRLATERGEVELPLADIHKAKLVLTEELIAAAQQQKITH
jgi:ribosome maturation factor RimP